jgi:hypothetical protein
MNSLQVSVAAVVLNPIAQTQVTTNVFHLSFAYDRPLKKKIMPNSYEEAMKYVEGRRVLMKLPYEQMQW